MPDWTKVNIPVELKQRISCLTGLSAHFAAVALLFLLIGCELPSKPDFLTEQRYSVPIVKNVSYSFLGGREAIIDTTTSDFSNLFTVDPDGLVRLGVTMDVNFGSFKDVIPEVNVDPLTVDTQINDLVPDISGRAATSFAELTGLDPEMLPPGTFIPGATLPPFDLELDMDDLADLVTREGSLKITVQNKLGISLQSMEVRFRTQNEFVGSAGFISDFEHDETRSVLIAFSDGELVNVPLFAVITLSWQAQQTMAYPDLLAVTDVEVSNFRVERATARFKNQRVNRQFLSEVPSDKFRFDQPDDFVELDELHVSLRDFRNSTDLDFESIIVSIPDIQLRSPRGVFMPQDTVVIHFDAQHLLKRAQHPSNIDGVSFDVTLRNVRLRAPGNQVRANVVGITENTTFAPEGDRVRTVNADEGITGLVFFEVSGVQRVRGTVLPRMVNLNNAPDYILDLADPEVRIESNVNDLKKFSEKIQNMFVDQPELILNYSTNAGGENLVYAAILGFNEAGEYRFLSGKQGTDMEVTAADTVSGLVRNGIPLDASQLVKLRITGESDGDANDKQVFFTEENSTIREFLSILPVSIHVIAKSLINYNEQRVSVQTPILLDTELSADIPITLISPDGSPALISDTLDVYFPELPGEREAYNFSHGVLFVTYSNELPLNIQLELAFLDEENDLVSLVPFSDQPSIVIDPAPANSSGFSTSPQINMMQVELNEEQLRDLWRSRRVDLLARLLPKENHAASLRAEDKVELTISGDFNVVLRVGGNP